DELRNMIVLCRSKLRPGGYLILTTPNNENLEASACICPECGCIFNRWQHVRSWTRGTLTRYLTEHDFRDIDVARTWFANRLEKTFYELRGLISGNLRNSSLFCI